MKKNHIGAFALVILICASCDMYRYGELGGADRTTTIKKTDSGFTEVMDRFSGVWYSHFAGMGRLDGYRIGKWGTNGADFEKIMGGNKIALFPGLAANHYRMYDGLTGASAQSDDYFVMYDDSVYLQEDDDDEGSVPSGGEGLVTRYLGIVRGVNFFNGDPKRGAIIIEYFKGCAPPWLDRWEKSSGGKVPFFGIYYRELDIDTIQMANAVDLAALYAGEPYYTEKATLQEAVSANNVENEAEFIAWGIVIPQDREKPK